MSLLPKVNDFRTMADAALIERQDIVVDKRGRVKLGGYFFSASKTSNQNTMQAFRDALKKEYGIFGTNAFDSVLCGRQQKNQSLRSRDIKAVLGSISGFTLRHFKNEMGRQLSTDPKYMNLPRNVKDQLYLDAVQGISEFQGKTRHDLAQFVANSLDRVFKNPLYQSLISDNPQAERIQVESEVSPNEPTGLKNLGQTLFKKDETSIEDNIRKGQLGRGMRINWSTNQPVILQELKKNGVEPGFIYKNDWSQNNTASLMLDFNSEASLKKLDDLKEKNPHLAQKCTNLSVRDQIMLFGRAHPAGFAAVADYMLEKNLQNPASGLAKLFAAKFPDVDPKDWRNLDQKKLKTELFVEIRRAILNVKAKEDPITYKKSPIFKHFADRHIMKLDYNEGDRVYQKEAGSAGLFRRPERVLTKQGYLFRLFTAQTSESISVGAVGEALANDLTRLAGIPTQDLRLVQGKYSDGTPKLMLEAKFADGYEDISSGYLLDGRIFKRGNESIESLGKYKAFFMVLADRDAIGSRGQNKGFAHGKFFAIDPGHSLEGQGAHIQIKDNFSFTHKDSVFQKNFKNFSVFDDDTRFAKFQGALNLLELQRSGKFADLFQSYRDAFRIDEHTPNGEISLRRKILASIAAKEHEFNTSLAKLFSACDAQFKLYDNLRAYGAPVQELAIEGIENLEKLTSPTTTVSDNGFVTLKHLAVIENKRIPWQAHVEGNNIVYTCQTKIPSQARRRLANFCTRHGLSLSRSNNETRITIPLGEQPKTLLEKLSERNVAEELTF